MSSTISYKTSSEWSDIIPIPQDDGPNPVVSIAYSSAFSECMDYFRAILMKKEYSDRALLLTADCIEQNSANYTAWYYRRECLYSLGYDLNNELNDFCIRIAMNTPKNYQLWHHRRCLIEKLSLNNQANINNELLHTLSILRLDNKNYHAWAHRQWLLFNNKDYFNNKYNNELEYVDKLLKIDVRNNSAWNERYFTIINTTGYNTLDIILNEVNYTINYINLAHNNEAPWNYLQGLLIHKNVINHQLLLQIISKINDTIKDNKQSRFALSTLVEYYLQANTLQNTNNNNNNSNDSTNNTNNIDYLQLAVECCDKLSNELDTVRVNYWNYRKQQIKQLKPNNTSNNNASNDDKKQ